MEERLSFRGRETLDEAVVARLSQQGESAAWESSGRLM